MEKMQSEARHLQELSARKALEDKMAKVIKSQYRAAILITDP